MNQQAIKKPKTLVGKVVSNRMDKTIVVAIIRKVPHPVYGKYIKRITKLFADDPMNTCQIGENVRIQAHAPISKKKHWVFVEKVTGTLELDLDKQEGKNHP